MKINHSIHCFICTIIALNSLFSVNTRISFAQGLSISPSTHHFKDVPVGKKYTFPVPISVKNPSDQLTSYTIRIMTPSQVGLSLDDGFLDIPSKKWVSFEKKHIATNPHETVSIKMFIEIPNKKEWLNKNWEFLVSVEEHFKPSSIFNIVSDAKILITTTRPKKN
ncbi:MAG: hypothetical protein HQK75_17380 [Candidatus Magnetomorum sp.]|nr:hypothetical protein [Candidatus Magnetomorum sp.]